MLLPTISTLTLLHKPHTSIQYKTHTYTTLHITKYTKSHSTIITSSILPHHNNTHHIPTHNNHHISSEETGFDARKWQKYFLTYSVQTKLEDHLSAPINVYQDSFPGYNAAGRETAHSSQSNFDIVTIFDYTSNRL